MEILSQRKREERDSRRSDRHDHDSYHLIWHLPFDSTGLVHTQSDEDLRFSVPGNDHRTVQRQFRDSTAGLSNVWPEGNYCFQLLGWAKRSPPEEPDLKSSFNAEVTAADTSQMREWRDADAQKWDDLRDKDRAIGFRITMDDHKKGL